MTTNECRPWIDDIEWDMIHEDAVTRFLEWGNNNFHDTLRRPVTHSGEYSIYFVVDTWKEPKVVLLRMDNYGAQPLCEKSVPTDMAERFLKEVGGIKGVHALNDEIKAWLQADFES